MVTLQPVAQREGRIDTRLPSIEIVRTYASRTVADFAKRFFAITVSAYLGSIASYSIGSFVAVAIDGIGGLFLDSEGNSMMTTENPLRVLILLSVRIAMSISCTKWFFGRVYGQLKQNDPVSSIVQRIVPDSSRSYLRICSAIVTVGFIGPFIANVAQKISELASLYFIDGVELFAIEVGPRAVAHYNREFFHRILVAVGSGWSGITTTIAIWFFGYRWFTQDFSSALARLYTHEHEA